MRRSEALEELSREHHHALVLAKRLRQATMRMPMASLSLDALRALGEALRRAEGKG
jgi:hypothetical protein